MRKMAQFGFVAMTALCCWSSQAGAYPLHKADYAFWRDMPEAARVASDVTGENDLDTAARQHAAFVLLIALVNLSADGRGQLPWPPRERALNGAYYHALPDLHALGAATGQQDDLWVRSLGLQADRSFTRPFLRRYFSERALREIEPYISGFEARASRQSVPRTQFSSRVPAAVIPARLVSTARTALFGVAALSTLLFLVGLVGELKGARIGGANRSTLVAGFRRYEIHTVTGFVRSPSKALETRTMVSGNQYNVSSSSTTYVHDQFFIAHPNGETSFQLVDFNLPLREGHRLSAVWAIRKGRERGPYIMFRNHTTNERIVVDKVLRRMLRPRIWPLLVLVVGVWAIGLYSALPFIMKFSESDIALVMPLAMTLTAFGILCWTVAFLIVMFGRVRRFKRRELSQMSETLDAKAQGLIGRMEGWASQA